ncbi:hypothetical protein LY76DRAFT_411187 [Colletotrichum caudatum]|nr:hypothetical protein LY76DRAFT_411187 [Colletotrichum caudatum]
MPTRPSVRVAEINANSLRYAVCHPLSHSVTHSYIQRPADGRAYRTISPRVPVALLPTDLLMPSELQVEKGRRKDAAMCSVKDQVKTTHGVKRVWNRQGSPPPLGR